MLYIYGVTRAGHPLGELKGVGRPPADVYPVTSGPLAAAVSNVPDDFAVEEADARAHLNVLIGLIANGTVVPLRLGTVAPDEDAVRVEVLDAARAEFAGWLEDLDGKVELHVDVDDNEAEAIAAVAGAAPVRRGGTLDIESALELGQRVSDLLIEHRRRLAEDVLATLRPIAVRDAPRSLLEGPEDPVLRWAFLVDRDDIATFDEAVTGIRAAHPSLEIHYVGPLPAAHFVDWQPAPDDVQPDPFQGDGSWGW